MTEFDQEQIKRGILNYLENTHTDYAILLNGEWGCGKTHFIKNEIQPEISKIFNKNILNLYFIEETIVNQSFIYLSLYEVEKIEELELKILLEVINITKKYKKRINHIPDFFYKHFLYLIKIFSNIKIFSKTYFPTFVNILKIIYPLNWFRFSHLDWITDLGLSYLGKNTGLEDLISIKQKILNAFFQNKSFNNIILCFDDLERTSIDIKTILGYVNNLIEHNKVKVIIVADETQIKEKEDYQEIKEKTIRYTFDYNSSLEHILDNFFKEYTNYDDANNKKEKVYNILKDNSNYIIELIRKSGSNNLRIVQYCIDLLCKCIEVCNENQLSEKNITVFSGYDLNQERETIYQESIIEAIINFIVPLSFANKSSIVSQDNNNIEDILKEYWQSKYSIPQKPIFIFLSLMELIKSNVLNEDNFISEIKRYLNISETSQSLFLKYDKFLTKKQFFDGKEELFDNLSKNKITDLNYLLEISDVLLTMSQDDFISESPKDIQTIIFRVLEHLNYDDNTKLFTGIKNSRFGSLNQQFQKYYQEILRKIKETDHQIRQEKSRLILNNALKDNALTIKEKLDEIHRFLSEDTKKNNLEDLFTPQIIFDFLLTLETPWDIIKLFHQFEHRYFPDQEIEHLSDDRIKEWQNQYPQDCQWLTEFSQLINDYLKDNTEKNNINATIKIMSQKLLKLIKKTDI